MKVLVAVKEVVEVADDFEIEGTRIAERDREYDLNEWDDYAIEEAVQLRESGAAEEVVAVTIGPERSEETIRMALAKGADRALRIWDDALADRDILDVGTKTALLAAAVELEDPDLVLSGVQSGDEIWGATGVSLAAAVDYGHAAVVIDLELEGDVAHVRRELEGGVEELTDVDLPAVLTIQTGINEPRYASLRGIRQAQQKEIEPLGLDDLSVDPTSVESPIELADMYVPESGGRTEYFEGAAEEQAAGLAEVLRERGVAGE